MRNLVFNVMRLFLAVTLLLAQVSSSLATDHLPPIIPETTHVLTETTTDQLASISADGALFTFAQSTPALAELVPGDIIVGGISQHAPYGFLRRVTTIATVDGQIILQTEPATVNQAIQQGSAHLRQRVTPADVQSAVYATGVSLSPHQPEALAEVFTLDIDNLVLFDLDGNLNTTSDQVVANGRIEVEPTIEFEMDIQDLQLKYLLFTLNMRESVDLSIEARLDWQGMAERQIASFTLAPFVIPVGFVPVVVTPVLTLHVGVDGNVHANLETSVAQEASVTAGIEYENNVWSTIGEFSHDFTYTPPVVSWGLDVKGYAGPRLSLLLFGIAGPYVQVMAYLRLTATSTGTPWWELFGGLEVSAGGRVEIFGVVLAHVTAGTISDKVKLAESQTAPPALKSVYVPMMRR